MNLKKYIRIGALAFLWLVFQGKAWAQNGQNPIFRNAFTADPAPMVHNGTLYVYVGHDEATGNQLFNITEWLCYSTTDMMNWDYHGSIMKPTDFTWAVGEAWASQVVEHNGKFYFYTTVQAGNPNYGKAIGVAVADSPLGPFVDAKGSALVYDRDTPGTAWNDIDPTVWIDDDGTAWMVWGNPTTYIAKLKPNMIEIDGPIETLDLPNYAEGPWLWKKDGLYYIMYPAFVAPVGSEQMCYATSTNVKGPYTYHGVVSPAAKNSYTTHPGVIEYKEQWYMFYHNANLTINGLGPATGRRSVCVEHLCYNEDGTIQYIPHTTAGVTLPSPCPAKPALSLIAPKKDSAVVVPADIYIEAVAEDPSQIQTLQFFVNGNQVGSTEWVEPYFTTVSLTEAGKYEVKAIANLQAGGTVESETFIITAHVPQAPFGEQIHVIPGVIEAENYDVGGQGFAHNDLDEINEGNSDYRAGDGVDVEETQDSEGDYNVGYIRNGEWLEYTVDVAADGMYDLDLRMAADGANKILHLEMDGENITGPISVPNTAGWQVWETVTVQDIELTAGEHMMRIAFDSDYMNLNYVEFRSQVVTSLNDAEVSGIKIYPNPFDNNGIKLVLNGSFHYEISDIKGTRLDYGKAEDNVLVGNSLEPGIYFITIQNKQGSETNRVIKF